MALPVGRGAFTLGSLRGLQPLMTEAIEIPPLILTGKIRGTNTTTSLDATTLPKESMAWPMFHNGVASGLRISVDQIEQISSTWIAYNKPFTNDGSNPIGIEAHAGVLMALGLQGHLKALKHTNAYDYFSRYSADMIKAALLIGMTSCRLSTRDQTITKLLSIHIPSLHPPQSSDLEVHAMVQTSAIMGLGLLYLGTANRRMAEVLLKEIGKRPTDDKNFDRESYSLAAGFAFGMITLGTGDKSRGLGDLNIEARLLRYIDGGKEDSSANEAPKKKRTDVEKKHGASASSQSNIVLEAPKVNVNITSPSATIALALMYLKTNNHQIASQLATPNTLFQLEYVSPDMLLLRVLARNLILWDQIGMTVAWVESQIPPYIMKVEPETPVSDPQLAPIEHAYFNIIAGCCVAVGLRYAGTFQPEAKQLLFHYLNMFIDLQKHHAILLPLSIPMVDSCINVCALALTIVMAGTGDLEILRVLRKLHKRFNLTGIQVDYGSHMAISMALGFLFFGGGRYTFNNSNQAVAMLLCSIYPRFPMTPQDNRYHLQAFRHFYVLASEQRWVECRDVETERNVSIPLLVQMIDGFTQTISAPCLLPPLNQVASVQVLPPRYWQRTLYPNPTINPLDYAAIAEYRTIYVKRKAGYLSYNDDPDSQRSVPTHSYPASASDPILYEELTQETSDVRTIYVTLSQIAQNLSSASYSDIQNLKIVLGLYARQNHFLINQSFTYSVKATCDLYFQKLLSQSNPFEQYFLEDKLVSPQAAALFAYFGVPRKQEFRALISFLKELKLKSPTIPSVLVGISKFKKKNGQMESNCTILSNFIVACAPKIFVDEC